MYQRPEDRLNDIKKELIKVQIFEAPGTILFGLGLYGKFAANGNAFHPFLNDPANINTLLVLGVAIMAWGGYRFFSLLRERADLQKQLGQ